MAMDLDQLASLVAVAETGGISAAARHRHLSQPAVSLQIKALEEELGTALLRRDVRGAVPTRAGTALLAHARRVLLTVRAARAEMEELRGLARGSLVLGATDAAATLIVPNACLALRQSYPGIEVAVDVDSTAGLAAGVRSGRFDLALGTLPVEDPELESRPLVRERLGLVAPAGAKGTPLADLLRREPFIAYPRGSVTRRLVDRALERSGLSIRVMMEIGRPSVMARLVQAGLGVSILPETTSNAPYREGRIHRFGFRRFSVRRDLGLLVLRGRELDPAARAFVALLEERYPAGERGRA